MFYGFITPEFVYRSGDSVAREEITKTIKLFSRSGISGNKQVGLSMLPQ